MKLVPLKELFHIQYGNQFDLNKMEFSKNSTINFISRSSQNMGIITQVEEYNNKEPFEEGLITVTLGGSYLLSSFVQQRPFYTAQNIKVLKPKTPMSDIEKLYYCFCIKANRFKYTSHGREANSTLDELLVPESMPEERKDLTIEKLNNLNKNNVLNNDYELLVNNWKQFKFSELFEVTGSKTTAITELVDYGIGAYPFVTTQATNNGIEGFYDYWTEKGNVLTIDSAVLGYCSYQPLNFSASDHVEKLIPNFDLDKYIALFLVTIINKEKYRYNYGRKASQTRLKERSIKLPSTKEGKPDWDFMRNYIKSLPYSASL